MTFQQLSFVVEVANCESINKAAERLYTSQSNVSNSIRIGGRIGNQIFLRTKRAFPSRKRGGSS
ncbi:MAG: LysR family transcriptional regulator [Oscillibacter sp.]|uniref:LysR family transcriptional regulator n=1 Tax=Oscillibacter sp. TaxID=1945593 RepID=UPI00132AB093|nr:LysR family transcriptional regulator [Oscillibacter sp.]